MGFLHMLLKQLFALGGQSLSAAAPLACGGLVTSKIPSQLSEAKTTYRQVLDVMVDFYMTC